VPKEEDITVNDVKDLYNDMIENEINKESNLTPGQIATIDEVFDDIDDEKSGLINQN